MLSTIWNGRYIHLRKIRAHEWHLQSHISEEKENLYIDCHLRNDLVWYGHQQWQQQQQKSFVFISFITNYIHINIYVQLSQKYLTFEHRCPNTTVSVDKIELIAYKLSDLFIDSSALCVGCRLFDIYTLSIVACVMAIFANQC